VGCGSMKLPKGLKINATFNKVDRDEATSKEDARYYFVSIYNEPKANIPQQR
jgi:hypothetical protein